MWGVLGRILPLMFSCALSELSTYENSDADYVKLP